MIKYIILAIFCLSFLTGFSQDSTEIKKEAVRKWHELKSDSATSERDLARMKELFKITSDQEKLIYEAAIKITARRRLIFKQYLNIDEFAEKMRLLDEEEDTIYKSIIGETNYKNYKQSIRGRLLKYDSGHHAILDSTSTPKTEPI